MSPNRIPRDEVQLHFAVLEAGPRNLLHRSGASRYTPIWADAAQDKARRRKTNKKKTVSFSKALLLARPQPPRDHDEATMLRGIKSGAQEQNKLEIDLALRTLEVRIFYLSISINIRWIVVPKREKW